MSLLTILDESKSAELGSLLLDIKEDILDFVDKREQARHHKMIIIGKIVEWKNNFPQRSRDRAALDKAMASESWGATTISENYTAYKEYTRLLGLGVPEYKALAENASMTHLLEFSRNKDTGIIYDAQKYLKSNGRLPSVGQLKQHKDGRCNSDFKSFGGGSNSSSSSQSLPSSSATMSPLATPKPYPPAPSYPAPQAEPERGMKNITKDSESKVIENQTSTAQPVSSIVESDSVLSADDITRAKTRAIIDILKNYDVDFASYDADCIAQLKPYLYQIQSLATAAERQIKPKAHYC